MRRSRIRTNFYQELPAVATCPAGSARCNNKSGSRHTSDVGGIDIQVYVQAILNVKASPGDRGLHYGHPLAGRTADGVGKAHRKGISTFKLTEMFPNEDLARKWFEDI